MKLAKALALVLCAVVGIGLASTPVQPASATVSDGCYAVVASFSWSAPASLEWTPRAGEGGTIETVGPAAGSQACSPSSWRTKIRGDTLIDPEATVDVAASFFLADPQDSCSAFVSGPGSVVLQNIALQRVDNLQTFVGNGSGLSARVPASTRTRQALRDTPSQVSMQISCTYGSPQTTRTWVLALGVAVAPAPYGEFSGVSINEGAGSVNTTSVDLNLSWDGMPDRVAISNDGGFGPGQTQVRKLTRNTEVWGLNSSGDERLPKTVYVRFHTDAGWSPTYTDDIILDTVPPNVTTVATTTNTVTLARVTTQVTRAKRVRVRLNASDNRTGVKALQWKAALKGRPHARKYGSRFTVYVPTSAKALYVRVRDGAGNWSRWKKRYL